MGTNDYILNFSEKDQNRMESNSMSIPTSEIHEKDRQQQRKREILGSPLRIKTPSRGEIKDDNEEDEDGFRTPISFEQRIPVIPECPPAPRKPKSVPSRKRKAGYGGIILDLSSEVEALFPPSLLADLGGKMIIKKVRKSN